MQLAKRYPFSASHRLHSPQLSGEENARVFGKCNNPFGHGHNYMLEVAVKGRADAGSGMVVSRKTLDSFVERHVISKLDHANLNCDVAELQGVVPTTENLALLVENWLNKAWDDELGARGVKLARVRIEETARNSFEVRD
jgi:6-pyruvoyltetrahydropterin/6-carboxytetrahydropterin synthase